MINARFHVALKKKYKHMKSSITQSDKQRDDYNQCEILPIRRGGSGQAI